MTQDEIIRMAREAGFDVAQWSINGGTEVVIYEEGPITVELKRFAALVAAHEREGCAKLCEEMWAGGYGPSAITAAIRARGEK